LTQGVSYNRNTGFALDADLALLDVKLTCFLGLRLNWNAELTGSCLKLKHDATQACVEVETQSYSGLRECRVKC